MTPSLLMLIRFWEFSGKMCMTIALWICRPCGFWTMHATAAWKTPPPLSYGRVLRSELCIFKNSCTD